MLSVVLVHVHGSEKNLLVESYQVLVKFLGSKPTLKFQRASALNLINALSVPLFFSNQIGWNALSTHLPFFSILNSNMISLDCWKCYVQLFKHVSEQWTARFCPLQLFGLQLHKSTAHRLQPKQLPRPARFCLLRLFGLQLTAHRLQPRTTQPIGCTQTSLPRLLRPSVPADSSLERTRLL